MAHQPTTMRREMARVVADYARDTKLVVGMSCGMAGVAAITAPLLATFKKDYKNLLAESTKGSAQKRSKKTKVRLRVGICLTSCCASDVSLLDFFFQACRHRWAVRGKDEKNLAHNHPHVVWH